MKVLFVTTNKHKFQEVKEILRPYPVELEQVVVDYEENHDEGLEEIARGAAGKLANKLMRPVVLEDTGLFFKAYKEFPGALPKFVFNALSYKGIFKLLEGETRKAYFKTVAAFAEPGSEPVLFEGIMHGQITKEVHNAKADVMPYDKIFIHKGEKVTNSEMSMKRKNSFSQRAIAFRKFGEYMVKCDKVDA